MILFVMGDYYFDPDFLRIDTFDSICYIVFVYWSACVMTMFKLRFLGLCYMVNLRLNVINEELNGFVTTGNGVSSYFNINY